MPDLTSELVTLADRRIMPGQEPVSGESGRRVGTAVADTFGVALAAASEPASLIVQALPAAAGKALCWLTGQTMDARSAALRNGTAAHALDFDDVSHQVKGHPSAVLVPTLTALLADCSRCRGPQFVEAYLAGYNAQAKLATAIDVGAHYRDGWHATATLGVMGAVVGGARLTGLPLDQVRHAIGIATSTSSGLRVNFGSMTKPLQVGLAAANAVQALQLARAGFTAARDGLSGRDGFLQVYGKGRGTSARPVMHDGAPQLNVKKYPCCYQLHRAADAALSLRGEVLRCGGVHSVRRISITVEPNGAGALSHEMPRNGLEAKFSASYVIETILQSGRLSLSDFADAKVQDWASSSAHPEVIVRDAERPPHGQPEWSDGYAVVCIGMQNGDSLLSRVDVPHGAFSSPLTSAELRAKFDDCIRYGLGNRPPRRNIDSAERMLGGLATAANVSATISRAIKLLVHPTLERG